MNPIFMCRFQMKSKTLIAYFVRMRLNIWSSKEYLPNDRIAGLQLKTSDDLAVVTKWAILRTS